MTNPVQYYTSPTSRISQRTPAFRNQIVLPSTDFDPSRPTRLYDYLGPFQAASLFLGGMASSVALRWFIQGIPQKVTGLLGKQAANKSLIDLSRNANKIEEHTAVYFTEGLPAIVNFARKHAGDPLIQRGLKAYLGAGVLGYALGSVGDGFQEVWVRREETQIRADLLHRMSGVFRQGIQLKSRSDNAFRETAKQRIQALLTQCRISEPEALMQASPEIPSEKQNRYPYEPTHFSKPTPLAGYRFGVTASELDNPRSFSPLHAMKLGMYGLGLASGVMLQGMLAMMKVPALTNAAGAAGRESTRIFTRIFNIQNLEALFLTGEGKLLMTVLGLTAASKAGKMLMDGYREVEVTRYNADTELRYQGHNWLVLDPNFHRIAEEEAFEDAFQKLREALPYEYNNRHALQRRIQTILGNIGRNSAPKYFQMTPPVNLVAARS